MPFLYPVAAFWPTSNSKATPQAHQASKIQAYSQQQSNVHWQKQWNEFKPTAPIVSSVRLTSNLPPNSDPYIDRIVGIPGLTAFISEWESALSNPTVSSSLTAINSFIERLILQCGPLPTQELKTVKAKKRQYEQMGRVEVAAQLAVLIWRIEDLLGKAEG